MADLSDIDLPDEPHHPLFPLPTLAEAQQLLRRGQGALAEVLQFRRQAIQKAIANPLEHEPEPAHWRDARAVLHLGELRYLRGRKRPSEAQRERAKWLQRWLESNQRALQVDPVRLLDQVGEDPGLKILILLGGNRSAKSRFLGKMLCETLERLPGTACLAISEDEMASIETQQQVVWHYLRPKYQHLNGKRDPQRNFYVNHSQANGFSERRLVLPNGSKLIFATYGEEPDDYEGTEWGHADDWGLQFWGDENMRLGWFGMISRRGRYRPGWAGWSFTPIRGMTPTISQAVGQAKTLVSRPAALLPDRVNVPGVPVGHMPYVQLPAAKDALTFYFHSELTPFGAGPHGTGESYWPKVQRDCEGKASDYVMRVAYGFTREQRGRVWGRYTREVHWVPVDRLPSEGTNYLFVDPAGGRNWFLMWVRVAPGNPPRFFIYRDWPDAQTYGEWAVPTMRATTEDTHKGWDGDAGPAQNSMGWGVAAYKREILRKETIDPVLNPTGLWRERDPYRCARLDAAMRAAELQPVGALPDGRPLWSPEQVAILRERQSEPIREEVRLRFIDPRAAANPQASDKGGVNILQLFAAEQRRTDGQVDGPRMPLLQAYSGKGLDDGFTHVAELLQYDETQPLCPLLNEPRLYVADACLQIDWMFQNYTARGGEDGACKDPADLVRYLAQTQLVRHITGEKLRMGGFVEGPV